MKIKSKKPKGQRYFKISGTTRPMWIEPIDTNLWFNLNTGEWTDITIGEIRGCISSYYAIHHSGYKNIWSVKAAKRTIAQWDVPKGTWFRVNLPWIGYDFRVRK